MVNLYSIIRCPLFTKKASCLLKQQKILCIINKNATKYQIKHAFYLIFKIKAISIRTIIVRGKKKKIGQIKGKQKNIKKAIITVNRNTNIDKFIFKPRKKL